jgi:hypothetical protein
MKRSTIVVIAMMLTAITGLATAATAAASGSHDVRQDQFAALRQATARYHDLGVTERSGRTDLQLCVDHMGQHYADQRAFSDGILDPLDPEAMVYADDGRGHLRLVAVEWVSTTPGTVMGKALHLNPALGVFVLHAWIWSPNPDGILADMNPRIGTCS